MRRNFISKEIEETIFLFLPSQVLHPNHAHMLDIKYSYLNILGHSEGCVTSCRKVN